MSRGQQGQVFKTGQQENQAYNTEAQTSFGNTQGDINSFANQVGQFRAANPYVQGGQAQTLENQQLSDTASGQAEAAGQALQGQAVRTGQNAGGAIAATENMQTQNERNLAGQEDAATQQRLAAGTGYQEAALQGTEDVAKQQDTLAQQQAAAAQGALGTQEQAAQTPSFMDELGAGVIQAGANFAGGFGAGMGKNACWLAAAVFDEDFDTGIRTNLVRSWLWDQWYHHWYAPPILWLYSKIGKRLAEIPFAVWLLRPLFKKALAKAVSRER